MEATLKSHNNVALGKSALGGNKNGDFNIGIGHAAGYYIDENDSYTFYLAAHDIDESGMCNYPDGLDSMAPLLYGDLLNGTLVVGSDQMHQQGALQVNGSITPVISSGEDNLGSYDYPWNKLYTKQLDSNSDVIESMRDFNPHQPSIFNLGSEEKPWAHGYFDNLTVNSSLNVTDLKYVTIDDSQFYDKQIHLASSGVDSNNNTLPYLSDEGIDGAGLVVRASGTDYLRSYTWTYKAPDLDWECVDTQNAYSRSAWLSNISIEIADGRLLKTQRVMSPDSLSLVGEGCYGFFVGRGVVLGTQADKDAFDGEFYRPDYISYAGSNHTTFTTSRESGIFIEDNLLSQYDGSETFVGFKRRYVDGDESRYVVSSHEGTQTPTSQFVAMRDRPAFGFSDSQDFLPETLLNTKGEGDVIFRHTGEVSSRVQLSSPDNLFTNGAEMYYSNEDSRFGILTKKGNTIRHALTVSGDLVGINNINPFATVTVGKDRNFNASIALQEGVGHIGEKEGWGTVYVRATPTKTIPNSLFYKNEEGEEFDLLLSSGDIMSPDSVYYDELGNTFVGQDSINNRSSVVLDDNIHRNTTVGHSALFDLVAGTDNVAIGTYAGSGLEFAHNNIFIGESAGALGDDLGQVIRHKFRVGNQDRLIMSGELPANGEEYGYVYFRSAVGVSDDYSRSLLTQEDTVTYLSMYPTDNSGTLIFDFNDEEALRVDPNGITTTRITFEDDTYFDTAFGAKLSEGTAITFSPESGSDGRMIDVDIAKLEESDEMYHDTHIMVQSSGENYKSSILNIARFVNPDNPEMFFDCGGGYNILISRNSTISNNKNCNNFIGGWKSGHNAEGFTNSLILGTKAGQDATMQNPDLSIDTAAVFLGYNAGRNSRNADNSIFIGPSAGQDSIYCDNSIFIGNSTGQSSASKKSIALGDNTLVGVDGENNLEIVADHRINNRLINGTMSNKFNFQGVIAGDHCSGRVSIGGAARVYPAAVLEVNPAYGDNDTAVQHWYDGEGNLIGYLDQDGNLVLKGVVIENSSYIYGNNLNPSHQGDPSNCGNTNGGGNVPIPGEDTNNGGNRESTSYSIGTNKSNVPIGSAALMTITRFGGTLNDLVFEISTTNGMSAPNTITIPDGVGHTIFSILGEATGLQTVTTNSILGSKFIGLSVVNPNSVPPTFNVLPSISPTEGEESTTFSSSNGSISSGYITNRIWRLNGVQISQNRNSVIPNQPGTLTFEVTFNNQHGSTTEIASAVVTTILYY